MLLHKLRNTWKYVSFSGCIPALSNINVIISIFGYNPNNFHTNLTVIASFSSYLFLLFQRYFTNSTCFAFIAASIISCPFNPSVSDNKRVQKSLYCEYVFSPLSIISEIISLVVVSL